MELKKTSLFPKTNEVALPSAPLVVVLGQVRFEKILSIQNQNNVAPFQESIRALYPLFKNAREQTTSFDPKQRAIRIDNQIIWQFSDLHEKWTVSLSSNFISLQTKNYNSRKDFLEKFDFILKAFQQHFRPAVVLRTGIRYVDRLTGDALKEIGNLVKPEFVGLIAAEDLKDAINAITSEVVFEIQPHRLFARWGRLPANTTTDPVMIAAVDTPSWLLDIDSSRTGRRKWNHLELVTEFNQLAEINYNFFRRTVNDNFLRHFGGNV